MLSERRALWASILLCLFGIGMMLGTDRTGAASRPPVSGGSSASLARWAHLPIEDQLTALPTVEITATFPPLPGGSITPVPSDTPDPTFTPKVATATDTPGPDTPTVPPETASPAVTGTRQATDPPPPSDTPGGPGPGPSPSATASAPPPPSETPTPRPTATLSPSPTPGPLSCRGPWQVFVRAFPDTVGKGAYNCPGCDGVFTDGDRYEAANCPLQPLFVVVSRAGDPQNVYFAQLISRVQGFQDLGYLIILCQPPPYEVKVLTRNPLCYTLCPNSPQTYILNQRDFDRNRNSRPGTGRYAQVDWRYWHCGLGTPGPTDRTAGCAILPVTERSCGGTTYPGLNGDFELPASESLDAEHWYDEQYAVRAWGPGHPTRGKFSLRLNPLGPGLDFRGRAVHDLVLTDKSPASAQLSVDLFWRDPGASGFELTAQLGKNPPVKVADQSIAQADWVRPSVRLDRNGLTGRVPITFTWQIQNGAEVYMDNVEVDFCCEQATATATPPPPTLTPTSLPSATPVTPTRPPPASETPLVPPTITPLSPPTNTPVGPPTVTPAGPGTATPEGPATRTPIGPPTVTPWSQPSDTPGGPATATPVAPPSSTPVGPPSNTPAGPPSATPAGPPSNTPAGPPSNTPAGPPSNTPAGPPSNTPAGPPSSTPAGPPSATPGEPPTRIPDDPPSATPDAPPTVPSPGVLGSPEPSASPSPAASASPTSQPSASATPLGGPGATRTPWDRPGTTPGPPGSPPDPGPEVPGDCPSGACLVIHKFHDLDRDGIREPTEPMLPGITFVITVDGREVRATTDSRGVLRVCFPSPALAQIVEDTRAAGGLWFPTTAERAQYQLTCGDNELWIGNAQVGAPRTGNRGARQSWRAAGGPHDYF